MLGGSVGLAVRQRLPGCRVIGCGPNDKHLIEAKSRGAVEEWTLDLAQAVEHADAVIVCTPVGVMPAVFSAIAARLKPSAIVSDVGSTKASVAAAGEQFLGRQFVGSHPMAGSEKAGIAAARADLLPGATCVVTPTPASDAAVVERVCAFWQALGMNIIQHDPAEHDRLVALVSHLPHAVAAAVVAIQEPGSLALHGKGFLDATRIAAGDSALWADILMHNRENMIQSLDLLMDELANFSLILQSDDTDALRQWLDRAASVSASLREAKTRIV